MLIVKKFYFKYFIIKKKKSTDNFYFNNIQNSIIKINYKYLYKYKKTAKLVFLKKFKYLYLFKKTNITKNNLIYKLNFWFFRKQNYIQIKNLKNYIITLHKTNFILNFNGFLYLTHNLYLNTMFYKFLLKKDMFSFNFDLNLHKFIMKSYLKNQIFQILKLKFDFCNALSFNSNLFQKNNIFYNFHNPISTNLNIKRIKFKPGYMNIWRSARFTFKKIFNLKFKYQYKLTKYFFNFNKILKTKIFYFTELTLKNILIKSKFINNECEVDFFIKNNYIYLNGFKCNNKELQVFVNDFIQLIINIKYYISYKWFINFFLKTKRTFRFNFLKKLKKIYKIKQLRSFTIFNWVLKNKYLIKDVHKFLEIDFLTLSIFLLFEPIFFNNFNVYNFLIFKYNISNLYNWKYIT